MPSLDARHARQLLEIAEAIYAAQDCQGLARVLLPAVTKLVATEEANLSEINLRNGASNDYVFPSRLVSTQAAIVWKRYMNEHPHIPYFQRTRDGKATTLTDFLSQRQWHRLALYNEFFRPLGLGDGLGFLVETDWPVVVGLGTCRAGWGFSGQERFLLNLLRPHVAQAWRNVRALSTLREENQAMDAALEAVGSGVMELDRAGRAYYISREAHTLVTRYFGDTKGLSRGRVPDKLRGWANRIQRRVEGTNVLPPRAPLVLECDQGQLTVRLLAGSDRCRLLLKEDPKGVAPSRLQGLGLTGRECEVLAWIAEGKTNAEIAVILGMSHYTVKRHVEDILQKLSVETRTAAAAIALHTAMSEVA